MKLLPDLMGLTDIRMGEVSWNGFIIKDGIPPPNAAPVAGAT